MEPAKTIEIIAKRTKECAKAGLGKSITFEVGGNSAQGSAPINFNFFNSLGDLPFLHLQAVPDTDEWEPNEAYSAGHSQLGLDTFYDNGNGYLTIGVEQVGASVYIDQVYVIDDQSTASVAYEFNAEITIDGMTAKAENRPANSPMKSSSS